MYSLLALIKNDILNKVTAYFWEKYYSQNCCIAQNDFKFFNRVGFFLAVNHRPVGGVTQITIETKIKAHSKQRRHLGKSEM